ncbi:MAG: hypothetical protein K9N51_02350 [Candidatus Pacebacteria bacterium]|nr:hypothetical protein [Candidatus Paceibacterota bacterium]
MTEQSDMDRATHALHIRREHDAMARAIREVLAEDDAVSVSETGCHMTNDTRLSPTARGALIRALPKKEKVV